MYVIACVFVCAYVRVCMSVCSYINMNEFKLCLYLAIFAWVISPSTSRHANTFAHTYTDVHSNKPKYVGWLFCLTACQHFPGHLMPNQLILIKTLF